MNDPAQIRPGARMLTCAVALALAMPLSSAVSAEPAGGSAAARQAMELCGQADDLSAAEKREALAHARALAESAVAADEHDAKAHFALVCTLGKEMQAGGIGLSTWSNFRQLRREIDATLALTPNDPDVLAAKGALLLHLPGFLGGDAPEAERLLRQALDIEPANGNARRYLAEALESRGATEEARAVLAAR